MDKLVEIARFQIQSKAYILRGLLESEGIECYLKDEYSNQIYGGGIDIGGVKVQIMDDQVEKALEIMKANGYEIPPEADEETATPPVPTSGIFSKVPVLRKYPLEKQLLILLAITAIILFLLVLFGTIGSIK